MALVWWLALPAAAQEQLHNKHAFWRQFSDSATARKALDKRLAAYVARGHAAASLDSFFWNGGRPRAQLSPGPVYRYGVLSWKNTDQNLLQQAGLWRLEGRPLLWNQLDQRMRSALDEMQQQGYPFAAFDSIKSVFHQSGDHAILADISAVFQHGPLIRIDSIRLKGGLREPERFIHALMRVKPGDAYNQRHINQIPRLLNSSPYFQRVGPAKVEFSPDGKANLDLNLTRRRGSRFDLLLGLLPSADPLNRQLQVTGLVDVALVSAFKSGEIIQFKFNKLTGSSQQLNLSYQQPWALGLPLHLNGQLNILKQEEIFSTRRLQGSLSYQLNPALSVTLSYRDQASALLDASVLRQDTSRLPPILSGASRLAGAGLLFDNLNARLTPTAGFRAQLEAGIGRRNTSPDSRNINPEMLAQILRQQPARELDASLQAFFPLTRRHVLMAANRTYWLGQDQYYENDLRQYGGGKSIRGFNENEFFASFCSFFSAEYRFMLETNSYLFGFLDYAYLENRARGRINRPMGTGMGLAFETGPAGVLSVVYAIGRDGQFGFQPGRGKLHIGLVSAF